MFPRIEYLEWIDGRPEAALHDLATSELRGDRDPGSAIPDILADRPDPPAGATVETQLATAYGVDPDQILVTAGASHANFVAVAAMFDAARESGVDSPRALVETPGYEPHVKTPRGLGGTVDRFSRSVDDDYRLDPDRLTSALHTDTATAIVTNRHNPSGRHVDRSDLAAIGDRLTGTDTRLLVDEVYAPYVTTDAGRGPFGGSTAAGLDNVVITNSLTKFFGLGDVRIGWIVADPEFIERARVVATHVPTVAGTGRAWARRALHAAPDLTDRARAIVAENHDLLATFIEEHPALAGRIYEDATFGTVTHPSVDGDRLARTAADAGVLVVPGRFFDAPEKVRISVGRPRVDCAASLEAFAAAIEALDS